LAASARSVHDARHHAVARRPLECAAMPCLAHSLSILRQSALCGAACMALALGTPAVAAASTVYKWLDASGVTHLSSERPPAGVKFERIRLDSISSQGSSTSRPKSNSTTRVAAATPEQAARRNEMLSSLQNRECVVALEAIDRIARSGDAVDPTEFKRLQQTADRNCSQDPARRREQEDMAAKLRVAKGDICVEARNELADMLEPGRLPTRDQLKTQQEFIEAHCKAPVR
jgi:hypothetical protein